MKLYEIMLLLRSVLMLKPEKSLTLRDFPLLMMERNEKLENVALWIKNLESDVTEMKAERENLAQREKVL